MKYHLVINGLLADAKAQAEELNGFRAFVPAEIEEGEAIFLCNDGEEDQKEAWIPAKKVKKITVREYSAEAVLEILCGWMEVEDLYIWGSGSLENELAVRAASRLCGTSLTDVGCIRLGTKEVTAEKMVYANHMRATFQLKRGPYCITLEKGADRIPVSEKQVQITEKAVCDKRPEYILSEEFIPEKKETGLEEAKVVVVGGRGCGNRQAIEELEETAKKLGGQLGISRPAAMNAWASMDKMVGVSGAMIRPEICITAGVSGAAAFYAGIEKSSLIIAINKDEKAPIMKKADVAIVDDFYPVMKALVAIAEEAKRWEQ